MDQEAIKNAEMRVAEVQSALDEAQRVLQAAERAQEAAERSARVMSKIALAAAGGLVLASLLFAVRRRRARNSQSPAGG